MLVVVVAMMPFTLQSQPDMKSTSSLLERKTAPTWRLRVPVVTPTQYTSGASAMCSAIARAR